MEKTSWLKRIHETRQTAPVVPADGISPSLRKIEGIKAVVFDVYGTLFSSGVGDISLAAEGDRDASIRAVLRETGIQATSASSDIRLDQVLHGIIHLHQDKRRRDGVDYPEVEIREVWTDFIIQAAREDWIQPGFEAEVESLVIDYECRVNPVQPMPGMRELLKQLHASGKIMSIISNAQFYTPLLFESFLGKTLKSIGFCEESSVWSYRMLEGKPSVRLYEVAAAKLKQLHSIHPSEVIYVGNDMRNDIWPAQKVGFQTALFAGDQLSLRLRKDDPDCRNVQPDLVLTGLPQIMDCLA